jgi:hypothetical protein
MTCDGTGWQAVKRTNSPYDKHNPQLYLGGRKIYYAWHEDHGPIEPIWVAEEIVAK